MIDDRWERNSQQLFLSCFRTSETPPKKGVCCTWEGVSRSENLWKNDEQKRWFLVSSVILNLCFCVYKKVDPGAKVSKISRDQLDGGAIENQSAGSSPENYNVQKSRSPNKVCYPCTRLWIISSGLGSIKVACLLECFSLTGPLWASQITACKVQVRGEQQSCVPYQSRYKISCIFSSIMSSFTRPIQVTYQLIFCLTRGIK